MKILKWRDLNNITLLDIHNAVMGKGEKIFGEKAQPELGVDEKNKHFENYTDELSKTNLFELLNK